MPPALPPVDSGSQKVQHALNQCNLKTRIVVSTDSTDLERVPGTRTIADEFVETTILVTEIQRCENTRFHVHAAPFGTRSQVRAAFARIRDRFTQVRDRFATGSHKFARVCAGYNTVP